MAASTKRVSDALLHWATLPQTTPPCPVKDRPARGKLHEVGRLSSSFVLAALAALLAAVPAAAQMLPADPPLATSSNVELLGHIPGSAAGMVFKDNYAYVSGWGGLTVLDIAQPDSPKLVGALPLPHFENEDVDLCGNTLLVVNDRVEQDIGAIMYVVNVANRPSPRSGGPAARAHRQRPRLGPHRQLRQVRLHAGVGRRRRPRRGRRPHRSRARRRSLGKFASAASAERRFDVTHDTELDSTGDALVRRRRRRRPATS